jgi:hypothetical protein
VNRTLLTLVAAATVLAVGHHVDHALRDLTGWPLEPQVNAFTLSLLIYPAIALGVALSWRELAGPRFWTILAAGGAAFILAIHLGPSAPDAVARIPSGYESPVAGALALTGLGALIVVLAVHASREAARWRRQASDTSV